jgi:Emfourin
MEITVRRTGGFAGVPRTARVQTHALDRSDADELHALVREADLPKVAGKKPPGADRFQYEIHVDDGDSKQHAVVHEGAMPEPVRKLVDRVQALSAG